MQEMSDELLSWVKNLSLAEKTVDSFFRSFKSYQEEEPEEFAQYFPDFKDEWLTVHVQSISYHTYLPDTIRNSIAVYLNIYYRGKDMMKYIGIFNLSGEFADDYLYIPSHKDSKDTKTYKG